MADFNIVKAVALSRKVIHVCGSDGIIDLEDYLIGIFACLSCSI